MGKKVHEDRKARVPDWFFFAQEIGAILTPTMCHVSFPRKEHVPLFSNCFFFSTVVYK